MFYILKRVFQFVMFILVLFSSTNLLRCFLKTMIVASKESVLHQRCVLMLKILKRILMCQPKSKVLTVTIFYLTYMENDFFIFQMKWLMAPPPRIFHWNRTKV